MLIMRTKDVGADDYEAIFDKNEELQKQALEIYQNSLEEEALNIASYFNHAVNDLVINPSEVVFDIVNYPEFLDACQELASDGLIFNNDEIDLIDKLIVEYDDRSQYDYRIYDEIETLENAIHEYFLEMLELPDACDLYDEMEIVVENALYNYEFITLDHELVEVI